VEALRSFDPAGGEGSGPSAESFMLSVPVWVSVRARP